MEPANTAVIAVEVANSFLQRDVYVKQMKDVVLGIAINSLTINKFATSEPELILYQECGKALKDGNLNRILKEQFIRRAGILHPHCLLPPVIDDQTMSDLSEAFSCTTDKKKVEATYSAAKTIQKECRKWTAAYDNKKKKLGSGFNNDTTCLSEVLQENPVGENSKQLPESCVQSLS